MNFNELFAQAPELMSLNLFGLVVQTMSNMVMLLGVALLIQRKSKTLMQGLSRMRQTF